MPYIDTPPTTTPTPTTTKMTVPSPHPAYAQELQIAQLAVQRAALLTKRVLETLIKPTASPITTSSPISQFLHHPSPFPTSPVQDPASPVTIPPLPRRFSLAKADTSPVTIADLAAQALLISALHTAFPHDTILGEEDASALRDDPHLLAQVWELVSTTRLEDEACEGLLARPSSPEEMMAVIEARGTGESGRVWSLDPIDGTSAFLKGGQYAISVALIVGGREVVGVLGCPNLRVPGVEEQGWVVKETVHDVEGMGLMLSAVRGHGATVRAIGKGGLLEGRRVERGRGKAVELRDVHFVDSSRSPATLTEKVKALAGVIGAAYPAPTELYSSHMRYASMVLGGREFVQLRWPKPGKGPWSIWDHAGSQLIYAESGAGKVTDLDGNPIDFTTGNKLSRSWGVITADESIHDKILELVRELRAAEA